MAELIDTHCHLEKFILDETLSAVLERAHEANIEKIVTVGTRPIDWELYAQLAEKYPEIIAYTVGLHPCDVTPNFERDLEDLPKYLERKTKPKAIGEIGLDYFYLPKDEEKVKVIKKQQREAFGQQIEFAHSLDLPIVVHSRNSFDDCIEVIDASPINWEKVVFHCFADGPDEVAILNKKGGWASFTGIITYKKADNVRQAVLAQGLNKLMLETDSPYLTPEPHRSKKNEPAFTKHIAERCASLFNCEMEAIADKTSRNAKIFYNL